MSSVATKDKNFFIFTIKDTGKTYKFDINECVLYGLRGTPIFTFPNSMFPIESTNAEDNRLNLNLEVFRHMKELPSCLKDIAQKEQFKVIFHVADTFSSLGYTLRDIYYPALVAMSTDVQYKQITINILVKFLESHKSLGIPISCSVYADYKLETLLKSQYPRYTELSKREKTIIKNYINSGGHLTLPTVISYAPFLATFFYEKPHQIASYLREFENMCNDLQYIPPKGDFGKLYIQVKQTFELKKQEIKKAKLEKHQTKRLFFENENFTIIVPTTFEQFEIESMQQSNCVFRTYLPQVLAGTTNIVFVRRKENPNQSYITCEVQKGKICQYLGRFNNTVTNIEALKFRQEYQEYLNSIR